MNSTIRIELLKFFDIELKCLKANISYLLKKAIIEFRPQIPFVLGRLFDRKTFFGKEEHVQYLINITIKLKNLLVEDCTENLRLFKLFLNLEEKSLTRRLQKITETEEQINSIRTGCEILIRQLQQQKNYILTVRKNSDIKKNRLIKCESRIKTSVCTCHAD